MTNLGSVYCRMFQLVNNLNKNRKHYTHAFNATLILLRKTLFYWFYFLSKPLVVCSDHIKTARLIPITIPSRSFSNSFTFKAYRGCHKNNNNNQKFPPVIETMQLSWYDLNECIRNKMSSKNCWIILSLNSCLIA